MDRMHAWVRLVRSSSRWCYRLDLSTVLQPDTAACRCRQTRNWSFKPPFLFPVNSTANR